MDKPTLTGRNFPTAEQDAAAGAVKTLGRYEGPESSYRLAFTDTHFLLREEMRPVRMQLELLKPEMVQSEQGIESTVVIFGSARIMPPDVAELQLQRAKSDGDAQDVVVAQRQLAMSNYYAQARRFATIVTEKSAALE